MEVGVEREIKEWPLTKQLPTCKEGFEIRQTYGV
jgi:hypothetical protein